MPLDPNIALSVRQPSINTPFEGLGQAMQLRAQQQYIASNQATEEERRQKIAKEKKAEADSNALADAYKASLAPDGTVDRTKLQGNLTTLGLGQHVPAIFKTLDEADEANANAKKAKTAAEEAEMNYVKTIGTQISAANFDPGITKGLLAVAQSHGHDVAQYQQLFDQNPDQFKALVTKLVSPPKQDYTLGTARFSGDTNAELAHAPTPPPTPITPYQKATLAQGDARLKIEQGKADREAQAAAQQAATFGTGTGAVGTSAVLPPGERNDAYLAKLPTATADKVKALIEGRLQLPTRFTKGDTYWQGLLDAATQYDPSFDAVNYNARAKTRQDFTSGKSAQTVNALNTVAQHLNRLSVSADKLNNTWSPTYNSVANFVSRHTGSPVVTNFETDKKAVVDELTRTWRQAGGTESDIKSWSAVLDAANSPDQIHGALKEMAELIEGKLSASESQYQQGMGTSKVSVITPEARQVLDRLQGRDTATPASGTTPAAPGKIIVTAPDGSQHPFDTQAQADAFKKLAHIP